MYKGLSTPFTLVIVCAAVIVSIGATLGAVRVYDLIQENRALSEQIKIEQPSVTAATTTPGDPETAEPGVEEPTEVVVEREPSSAPAITPPAYTPPPTPKPKPADPPATAAASAQGLTISSVYSSTAGDKTTLAWVTNLESNARVVINDDFYVSDYSDATVHAITFSDLPRGKTYNFEIIATAGEQEANHFGSFSTPSAYTATFAHAKNDDDCFVVTIEDGNGGALEGAPIKVSGFYSTGAGRFSAKTVTGVTSVWGELLYCHNIDEITVVNTDTGKVYFDGTLPLYWY